MKEQERTNEDQLKHEPMGYEQQPTVKKQEPEHTRRCPSCGRFDDRQYVWGFPEPEDFERAEKNQIRLMGCIPPLPDEPIEMECPACGQTWTAQALDLRGKPVRAEQPRTRADRAEAIARKLPRLVHITFLATDGIHQEVPVSHLRVLLLVGAEPGLSISEYAKRSGLTLSGCSRALIQLSALRRQNEPGPDLVTVGINPVNRRERTVRLTPKGQRLYDSIVRELEAVAN